MCRVRRGRLPESPPVRLRVLILAALMPLALWAALPIVSAGAPTRGDAAQITKQLDETRKKIGKKKGTERVLTSDITRYSHKIKRLQGRIGGLQARVNAIGAELDRKRAELGAVQVRLRSERARLTRLRVRLVQTRRLLATRMVEIYKADAPSLVTVVMNARGFEDLLERGEFLRRISENDRRIVTEVRAARADAISTATRLVGLERRKQKVAALILVRRTEVAEVKDAVVGTRTGLSTTKSGKQAALGKVRGDRRALEDHEEILASKQREIERKLNAFSASADAGTLPDQGVKDGGGQFIWPVNGPITGAFGEQRPGHIHAGIDIAVPSGTPIHAAGAGKVVLMQGIAESGGYGNYTCVAHTVSLSTCYAHQSRFGTSVGATVTKGQVIGYVGNTGHSFGDHLHFEVRVNGVPTQPLSYL